MLKQKVIKIKNLKRSSEIKKGESKDDDDKL